MPKQKCRQLRTFPVFEWDFFPGKGLVADLFVGSEEEDIQIGDAVVLDEECYIVAELILYVGTQSDAMIGVVTEELKDCIEVPIEY